MEHYRVPKIDQYSIRGQECFKYKLENGIIVFEIRDVNKNLSKLQRFELENLAQLLQKKSFKKIKKNELLEEIQQFLTFE